MEIDLERLAVDGTTAGAIVRRLDRTDLRVLEAYRTPDGGLVARRTVVSHPGDVRDWTRVSVQDASGESVLERPTPTTVTAAGRTLEVPAEVLPRCAAPLVLAEMLAHSSTETEGYLLDVTPQPSPPVPAHFSVGNPETVQVPGVGPRELGVVTLFEDGRATDQYWFDSHEIVLSRLDRPGADAVWGHLCPDRESLLAGQDPEVARQVQDLLG